MAVRMRVNDVVSEYAISRSKLYGLAKEGKVEIVVDGNVAYVMLDSLHQYLNSLPRLGESHQNETARERLVEARAKYATTRKRGRTPRPKRGRVHPQLSLAELGLE